MGTVDLFTSCSDGIVGIPENYNGFQNVKFGENYAGCYFYAEDNYREYIQGSFKTPLKKGEKYKVSFYISLGDKSKYALKNIGFSLTRNHLLTSIWTELSEESIKNIISTNDSFNTMESESYFDDQQNWIYLSKEIIAKGGEYNITIGNFQKNSKTKKKKVSKGDVHNIAYYYIDLVSLESLEPSSNITVVEATPIQKETIGEIIPVEFELEKNYVIENINFQFDSVELTNPALEELQHIYNYLEENKDTKIEIFGHTDNKGSDEYNAQLSEIRAYSVADYFRNKGLSKTRIQSFGFGYSKPVSSNETEKGRKENRRVEFRISKF